MNSSLTPDQVRKPYTKAHARTHTPTLAPASSTHPSSPLSDSPASPVLSIVSSSYDVGMGDVVSAITEEELKTRSIHFLKFPHTIRQRIYHFLGYPVFTNHTIPLVRLSGILELRQRYNVNYCPGAHLSQPWNFGHRASGESDRRAKDLKPQFFAPLLQANREIRDELYAFLYGKAMFEVTLNGWRYVISQSTVCCPFEYGLTFNKGLQRRPNSSHPQLPSILRIYASTTQVHTVRTPDPQIPFSLILHPTQLHSHLHCSLLLV
jgi:hypothetical protein